MNKCLLLLLLLACAGTTALAGPNANGTLVLALADGVVYTSDESDYCGATDLQDCSDFIGSYVGPETIVVNLIAAFPSVASPRLAGVTFGWAYDESDIVLVAQGSCGDFELPTSGWPGSEEGTAVTWAVAETSTLVDVYWLAGYLYYGGVPRALDLVPHPTQGAMFADDDVPSNLDPIAELGSFGFSTEGNVPCPQWGYFGACCFPDGSCEILFVGDCEDAGGEPLGDQVPCDPNPCPQPELGACCLDVECTLQTETDCLAVGGEYLGDGVECAPENPCVVPTLRTSWGVLKSSYR